MTKNSTGYKTVIGMKSGKTLLLYALFPFQDLLMVFLDNMKNFTSEQDKQIEKRITRAILNNRDLKEEE